MEKIAVNTVQNTSMVRTVNWIAAVKMRLAAPMRVESAFVVQVKKKRVFQLIYGTFVIFCHYTLLLYDISKLISCTRHLGLNNLGERKSKVL